MAYNWNFEKLPKEKHNEVLNLIEQGRGAQLMIIHNEYELSRELYCCSVQEKYVLNWFIYGRDTGQIKEQIS